MVNDEARTVRLGSRVRYRGGQIEEEYRIVPECEADVIQGHMSDKCAIGAALLGRRVGDVVRVRAPGGNCTLTVLEVG